SPKKGLVRLETPKDKQYLAHTNHLHKLNDGNKPAGDVSGKTIARQAKADELMAGEGPVAMVEHLKTVLMTKPANNTRDTVDEWYTLESVIVVHDRDDLQMWASAGWDPKRGWKQYRFK